MTGDLLHSLLNNSSKITEDRKSNNTKISDFIASRMQLEKSIIKSDFLFLYI